MSKTDISRKVTEMLFDRVGRQVNETEQIKDLDMYSVDCVEYIMDIESTFDIEFPYEMLSPEDLDTVANVIKIIEDLSNAF